MNVMTTTLFNQLGEKDQELVLIYFISGIAFLVFSYLIYYCQYTYAMIRISAAVLMFGIGFMFMSTGGKIIQGGAYDLIVLTQWAVILCTLIALWVVIEFLKWNKKKQVEKGLI